MSTSVSARPRHWRVLPAAVIAVALAVVGSFATSPSAQAAAPPTIDNPSFEIRRPDRVGGDRGRRVHRRHGVGRRGLGLGLLLQPRRHLPPVGCEQRGRRTDRPHAVLDLHLGRDRRDQLPPGRRKRPGEPLRRVAPRLDDTELMRATNTAFADSESSAEWCGTPRRDLGEELYLEVVDTASGGWGHLNLDDVRTYAQRSITEIANPGFETGDLEGWTTTGEAFTAAQVTDAPPTGAGAAPSGTTGLTTCGAPRTALTRRRAHCVVDLHPCRNRCDRVPHRRRQRPRQPLRRAAPGVGRTPSSCVRPTLRSPTPRSTAACAGMPPPTSVRTSTSQVVDNATGGWGHINVDAFDTNVEVLGYEFDNAGFETGTLQGWTAQGDAFSAGEPQHRDDHARRHPFDARGHLPPVGRRPDRREPDRHPDLAPVPWPAGAARSASCSAARATPTSTSRSCGHGRHGAEPA